jgi:hypothetical protein
MPYARSMTITELDEEIGVDVDDVAVMATALGEQLHDELTWDQAADLRDVLEAKLRARHGQA